MFAARLNVAGCIEPDESFVMHDPHAPTVGIDPAKPASTLPERIGPYQILGLLGEGGMGRVYLAREEHPEREVALKVMRGMSASSLSRFRRESQLLAKLEHPGICRVYAAGEDVIGGVPMPWLALERVRGHELRLFVEHTQADLAARLRLIIAICRAVQYAHEHGVIHRDLKPGNILVDDEGQPRILDFGIARLSEDTDGMTGTGQVLGTLPYISPEQLAGQQREVDERTDVYALGVIAYELISGRLPHPRLTTSTLFEALDILRYEQPPRLASLSSQARGDLDTVVMKALASEAAQRYATAAALADDLQRLLDHRPVLARAPTMSYRISRFVRRHRALTAAASIVFLALVATAVISTLAAQRARAALAEATARTAELAAVNDFVETMLVGADPELGGSADMPLREVLEHAEQALVDATPAPRVAGQVALLLGKTWSALGERDAAKRDLARAQGWIEQGFGSQSEEAAQLRFAQIEDSLRAGDAKAAIAQSEHLETALLQVPEAWAAAQRVRTRVLHAQALEAAGDVEGGIRMNRELLADAQPPHMEDGAEVTDVIRHNLAYALVQGGDASEAEGLIRATLSSESARLGADHPQTLYTKKVLGQALHRQGRLTDAVELYREVYDKRRTRYGAEHPLTLNSGSQLAAALNTLNRPEEAEPLLRHALEARIARGEGETQDAVVDRVMLITTLDKLGHSDQALALANEVIAMEHGQPTRDSVMARSARATLLHKAGRIQESRAGFDEVLRIAPDVVGENFPNLPVIRSNAAAADLAAGDAASARDRLEPALAKLTEQRGPEHPQTQLARKRLAEAYTALGLADKATALQAAASTTAPAQ
ncbi:MAG TPA: serine/threonine-protein kinase [Chiayiivirga sp.]|nr:serine/threonine-protein kinase [Chiayiivirga sp.]